MAKALLAAALVALLAMLWPARAVRETAYLLGGADGGAASYRRGSLEMIEAARDER